MKLKAPHPWMAIFVGLMLMATELNAQNDQPSADGAQVTQKYLERNAGVAYTMYDFPFPGASHLWGARKLHANGKTFTDLAGGLAIPSLVTGRVGIGSLNPETKKHVSAGIRIFPAYAYMRWGFPLKPRRFESYSPAFRYLNGVLCEREFSLSIEVSPFMESSSDAGEFSAFYSKALLTFGWTWLH